MSLRREIEAVRTNGGLWIRHDHTVVRLTGRDAAGWLQSQATNAVVSLNTGQGNAQALLDRQGRVQVIFTAHRWEDEFWLVMDRSQVAAFLARIESHVILEDVQAVDVGQDAPQICLEGPRTPVLLHALSADPHSEMPVLPGQLYEVHPCRLLDREVLCFRMSESREDGYLLIADAGETEGLFEDLAAEAALLGMPEVSEAARETLRLESGWPIPGRDIDAGTLLPATPQAREAVDYGKGCYLGQEVVARLRAYGSVKHALSVLLATAPDCQFPTPGTVLLVSGARVGEIRRSGYSPTLGRWLALAYLDREHRVPGALWEFQTEDGLRFEARAAVWPAIEPPSRSAFARRMYEEALAAFEADHDDEHDAAISLLREVVVLDPTLEDAYEALGVILHRHQRTDEAIEVMLQLERLNPNAVMVHSNLSVFYVAKGMIAEAEAEKAKAQQLEFRRELDERAAERAAQAERIRLRAEAEQRIGMFKEVLEFDPEDPVATMGLGSAYIQLGAYAEAIPYLETATRTQRDYSAAWLNLGKCHEFLGQLDAARAAYRDGIAAASRKGDLMPLREMERRMESLQPTVS